MSRSNPLAEFRNRTAIIWTGCREPICATSIGRGQVKLRSVDLLHHAAHGSLNWAVASCGQLGAVLNQQWSAHGYVENAGGVDTRVRLLQGTEWKQTND